MGLKYNFEGEEEPTQFFIDKEQQGLKPSESQYIARSFFGQVNILMNKNDLSYSDMEKMIGLKESTIKNNMSTPYKSNGERNPNYRYPAFSTVIAVAIIFEMEIDEVNNLLDSADMAPLKLWRYNRGDDIILKFYPQILSEIREKKKAGQRTNELDSMVEMNKGFKKRTGKYLISGGFYEDDDK